MLGTRNPRKPEVEQWQQQNPTGPTGTFAQAAEFGELLVIATLGRVVEDVIRLAGPAHFAGQTVMDTTNPIDEKPPVGGILSFTTRPNESLAEQIQSMVPEAHVVKAFNSVGAGQMVNPSYKQGTPTMFFRGDDAAAKQEVRAIIQQFGGSRSIAADCSPRALWNRRASSGAYVGFSTINGITRSSS